MNVTCWKLICRFPTAQLIHTHVTSTQETGSIPLFERHKQNSGPAAMISQKQKHQHLTELQRWPTVCWFHNYAELILTAKWIRVCALCILSFSFLARSISMETRLFWLHSRLTSRLQYHRRIKINSFLLEIMKPYRAFHRIRRSD